MATTPGALGWWMAPLQRVSVAETQLDERATGRTPARTRSRRSTAPARGDGAVKTAARTIDIFEVFAEQRRPLSLSEIAAHIGAPPSSCHALLRTLRDRGYLYPIGGQKRLYPTRRLADLWDAIAGGDPVLPRLAPSLEKLRDRTGETVILGKLQDRRVVYIEVFEGLQTIRYTARAGDFRPLHSSAIGKALLGELSEAEREAQLGAGELRRITPATLVDRERLRADLELGRKRRYYLTEGENVPDVMGLAVPVTCSGDAVGIALAGPVDRMREHVSRHVRALLKLRRSLEIPE